MKQFKYKIIAFALSIVTVFAPFININSYAGGGASISFETQVDENGNEYVVDGEGHRHYLEEGRGYDQWSNADKRSFWIKVISQFLVQKKGVITDNESLWKFLGDTYYIGYELNNHTYEEMFLDVFRNMDDFTYQEDIDTGEVLNVEINSDVANAIEHVWSEYKEYLDSSVKYGYSYFFPGYIDNFISGKRYQAIKNLLNENRGKVCVYMSYYWPNSDPTGTDDRNSIQKGGNLGIFIGISKTYLSLVKSSESNTDFYVTFYNDDWQPAKYSDFYWYGFSSIGDTSLSLLDNPPYGNPEDNMFACHILKSNSTIYTQIGSNINKVMSDSFQQFIIYDSTSIMKKYNMGNLPYYTTSNFDSSVHTYDSSQSISTINSDNSISYGAIQSYVNSQSGDVSLTDINNYINNYYITNNGNGSGENGNGSGSSGNSGSGDSGSSLDFGWLGKIGEIIGGLISALGNALAGLIDGIASLIESIVTNLPNVLGQLMAWLMPYLPPEIAAMISAFFLVAIIVGIVKLIKR